MEAVCENDQALSQCQFLENICRQLIYRHSACDSAHLARCADELLLSQRSEGCAVWVVRYQVRALNLI